jgi:hypothetical protein
MARIIEAARAGAPEDFFRAVNEAAPRPHCLLAPRFEEWLPSPHTWRSTMEARNNVTIRALRDLALLAGAGLAAASIWAAGLPPEQGFLVDAQTWQDEVASAAQGDWPKEGWYRIVPRERGVDVQRTSPADRTLVAADALFLRLPGAALKTGARPGYRYPTVLAQPQMGRDYELSLAATRFSVRVDESVKGMAYTIGYGGQTYNYVLGPFDALTTSVRFVADLDGDRQPDFLVDVDDASYLLLSTRAKPGANLPAAQLFGDGGC